MSRLLLLLAQADAASPINAKDIPGVVGIPTWLLISCIVALAVAIVSMFGTIMWLVKGHKGDTAERETKFANATTKLGADQTEAIKKIGEEHVKAMESKISEHRIAFQDQADFWQKQIGLRDSEITTLGKKLDERHDEALKIMRESGESLKIVELVVEQLKQQQSRGQGGGG